ncbi:MAG: FkbM family methyltransferase [Acidobacteria bacterium]|nr:FkbM family methyltransferase [Acidobacteriota bacterium]
MNKSIKKLFLALVRFYTYHTPIDFGRHRVYLGAMSLIRDFPPDLRAATKDGRRFSVNLATGMQTTLYFHGDYEKKLTEVLRPLVRAGDVCLDVGANFGWYTSIFHKYAGPNGRTHAFEPMPPTFAELEKNYELMNRPANVRINNLALGEKPDTLYINLFEGLSTGHASMSNQGRDDAVSFECRVVTLDSYLEENGVGDVNFVKVDIEGAELTFLKGAESLFKQKVPPIWLMEMARQQTRNFGYTPDDLLRFFSERADYEFYRVDEERGRLIRFESFGPDDIGANVFCFPKGFYRDRFASVENYLA